MDLKQLKSGSDIRGTALAGYGEDVNLTDESVRLLVNAFVVFLSKKLNGKPLKIALGHDSRLSAQSIKENALISLNNSGVTVYDCGLCSTPSMFMMTKYPETMVDGSIMITASHHPVQKNGLKFFTAEGGLGGNDISTLIELAEKDEKIIGQAQPIVKQDFLALYSDFLVKKVVDACGEQTPLKGFKIVVDAGNGAGGFYADRVLKTLGANVEGSQFLEPDGNFPNHKPNPEDKTAMDSISKCVLKNNADLGIIFDTDVDRAAVVDSSGDEINRNKLIALISDIILSEQPNATIVTDSVTSDGLTQFIEARQGKHHRFKRGYRNVIDEAIRLESLGINAPLAIETSGHAALKENYYLDDGAYLVTRLLIKMAKLKQENKKLDDLIIDLKIPKDELEVRLSFNTDKWKDLGNYIIDDMLKIEEEDMVLAPTNYEGVRFSIPKLQGWFLIRMSVHDPIMPINIESDVDGNAKKIAKIVYSYLSKIDGLNTENLLKVIK